jgi:hypothetical protein
MGGFCFAVDKILDFCYYASSSHSPSGGYVESRLRSCAQVPCPDMARRLRHVWRGVDAVKLAPVTASSVNNNFFHRLGGMVQCNDLRARIRASVCVSFE